MNPPLLSAFLPLLAGLAWAGPDSTGVEPSPPSFAAPIAPIAPAVDGPEVGSGSAAAPAPRQAAPARVLPALSLSWDAAELGLGEGGGWGHTGQTAHRTDLCCLDIQFSTKEIGPLRRGWFLEFGGFHQNLDDGSEVVVSDFSAGPSLQFDAPLARVGRIWLRAEAGMSQMAVWRDDLGLDWGWSLAGRIAYVPPIPKVHIHVGGGVLARGYSRLHPGSMPALTLFMGAEL